MYTQKISNDLYLLAEKAGPAVVTMWLAIGSKNAALIDAGFGITGTLRKLVQKITELPVVHLVTHCDPDHAGGSAQFDDIHMSSLDGDLQQTSLNFKKRVHDLSVAAGDNPLVKLYLQLKMTKAESFDFTDIQDGETFELGGASLKAFAFPGHTKGSMCFVNEAGGYAVTGDSIVARDAAILGDRRCPPLTVYRDSLRRFLDKGYGRLTIYIGHSLTPLDRDIPAQLIAACDEVLGGGTSNDLPFNSPFAADRHTPQAYEHCHDKGCIRYLRENLTQWQDK
jgi:glyoxylase-like metal-dependent hydrolase (beta-lactamase superfamily II)